MNKQEKIIAVSVLCYVLFGLFQLLQSGVFIPPFLLNETIVFAVSLYFLAIIRPFQPSILVFSTGSFCLWVGSRFFIESVFSYQQAEHVLTYVVWDYLQLIGYTLYTFLLLYMLIRLRHNTALYQRGLLFVGITVFCVSWIGGLGFYQCIASFWIALWLIVYLRLKKEQGSVDHLCLLFVLYGLLNVFTLMLYHSF